MTQLNFSQQFGGDWTEIKLAKVEAYLKAYGQAMKKTPFKCAYIDAFAGTGYRTLIDDENKGQLAFPELVEKDSKRFMDGSARIALKVRPPFSRYIFIEKDPQRFIELQKLKVDFPEVAKDIELQNREANEYLQDICKANWLKYKRRAVLFLDPFGMEVKWETIQAIAKTRAIDLWILFPLGVAINRMLKRDGQINETWRKRLNAMFGTIDWYDAFYQTKTVPTFFGDITKTEKTSNFNLIGQFFVKRLETIFAGVAPNPLPLYNSRNNPLYLLCFACGNERGKDVALRIARHILEN